MLGELWSIAKHHGNVGRRRMILRHFLALDRFTGLRYALEAMSNDTNEWAVQLFDEVMVSWNRSFSSPRRSDLAAIESFLPGAAKRIDRHRAELLLFTLSPYRGDVESAARRVQERHRAALDRMGQ